MNTANTGTSDRLAMANKAPQFVTEFPSAEARSARETGYNFGLLK